MNSLGVNIHGRRVEGLVKLVPRKGNAMGDKRIAIAFLPGLKQARTVNDVWTLLNNDQFFECLPPCGTPGSTDR
jgi:hypothetical protein